MVKENQISITEFELVFSTPIQCHSSYKMENANAPCKEKTLPRTTLAEKS